MRGTVRRLVGLSLVAGLFYPLLWTFELPPATLIAAKGAGVGLLALAAALEARTLDNWLLALLLALGAAGDVSLEISFGVGAAAFAAAHLVSILLYLRNRRSASARDWGIAALLPVFAAAFPGFWLRGVPEGAPFALYGLLLGTMAASAWLSRFPRGLVALGALLFLASDMAIALRTGMTARPFELGLAIWLLYYSGQFLIFVGVISSLPAKPAGKIYS
ncbi:MAG: lysoplasmalogenase family protein [Allosphingosinicella sp.]